MCSLMAAAKRRRRAEVGGGVLGLRRRGARRSAGRRCRGEGTWSTRLGIAAHAAAVPQGQLPFGAAVKLRRLHVAPWWCAEVGCGALP